MTLSFMDESALAAIPSSSPPAWEDLRLRLVSFARRRLGGVSVDGRGPEDFAQEAIAKHLSGSRACPPGMALLPFLQGIVSSLVSHATDRRGTGSLPDHAATESTSDVLARSEALRSAWTKILTAVRGDRAATRLLEALIASYPEQSLTEIAAGLRWSPRKTRVVWRRIRARARRHFGEDVRP